ncbi:unnamed protein product [Adineta ricciae]|uniref:Calcineurin-like phosphoesterase domain-containing protein n=1 Tax=Adineta ricciae TaxID=249248 RepID=A0A814BEP4_ADIRI|nr:unnamed protein product [Adineta ricciae]CAF0928239.1 unnamed protein product [Adineta ricciae]
MSQVHTAWRLRLRRLYIQSVWYTKFKRWKLKPLGIVIILGLIVIFINESLAYQVARLRWPNIEEIAKKPTVEKLLLVADPQLIGEKDEGIFGFITRTDADRYIRKTFAQVNAYINPHWVAFLGDIFDEGLSASDDEFKRYFERFDSIFDYKNHEQRYIIVSGDNDVGGEYYGDKQPMLRQRFRNFFGRNVALYHQNDIQFLKLDIDMFDSYTNGKRDLIMEQIHTHPMTAIFRIVLNHWPIVRRTANFVKPFMNDLEPNLILKGDSHHFSITMYDRISMKNTILAEEYLTRPFYTIDLGQKNLIYEISVPTCSYRMGVNRIGYVVLLLDSESQTAHVTILLTPKRYTALCFYIFYVIFAVLFMIVTSLFSRRTLIQIFELLR